MQRVKTETVTEVQSMTLVKNVLRSAFSTIAYLRYIFPEENFVDTTLSGLKIKTLTPNGNSEIQALNEWLENGVFDALQKHYLRAVVFSIFSKFNDPSSLLESYTFKFNYPSDGNIGIDMITDSTNETLKFMSKDQIQKAWCTMIRTLITLSQTLPPLPKNRHIAVRVYYYEEVTPDDYQPPGFNSANEVPPFEFENEATQIEIAGKISTKYHTVSLRLDTAMEHYEEQSISIDDLDVYTQKAILATHGDKYITASTLSQKIGLAPLSNKFKEVMDQLKSIHYIDDSKDNRINESDDIERLYQDLVKMSTREE